jgi:hypothetical protein
MIIIKYDLYFNQIYGGVFLDLNQIPPFKKIQLSKVVDDFKLFKGFVQASSSLKVGLFWSTGV